MFGIVPGTGMASSFLSLASSANQGLFEARGPAGKNRIYVFKHLRLNEQSPPYFSVFVGIPKAEILHQANLQMANNLSILFIAVLMAMGMTWTFGEFLLVKPINRLVAATRQFADGEMKTRTGLPHGPDELGGLPKLLTIWRQCWKTNGPILKQSWPNGQRTCKRRAFRPNRQLALDSRHEAVYWSE